MIYLLPVLSLVIEALGNEPLLLSLVIFFTCLILCLFAFSFLFTHTPADKPSQPGTPEITDYDNTSVDLLWTPPQSDGGSKITHYIIQKKLKSRTDWEDCGQRDTPTGSEPLVFKVENLKEKSEVQFRVIAVNKAGQSPASEPTKMHLVKHRKCKLQVLIQKVKECA